MSKCENCIHYDICCANALDQFYDGDCNYFENKDFYIKLQRNMLNEELGLIVNKGGENYESKD